MSTPETSLCKPEVYESKRIQLTSPLLHIGSAVSKLNPFEYVQTAKRVYLPNQEALAKALHQRGRLQEYIRRIEDQEPITSLLEDTFGEYWQNIKSADGEPIFPKIASSLKWTDQRITDLRPMIRNGFGQLYIPGSSIKGAIRTAIAYHLLKHSPEQVSDIERKLRVTMGQIKQRPKFADDKLFMEQLFSGFTLTYDGKPAPGKTSPPNTDFMRAVQVTDAEPLLEKKVVNKQGEPVFFNLPVAVEVIICSHFQDWKAKYKAPIFAEMVRKVKTHFTISIDQTMLSWFRRSQGIEIPFQTVDDILGICREFAQDQWDEEHYYWQNVKNNPNARDINNQVINLELSAIRNFYEAEDCPYKLRIGWASGMNGTTVNLVFEDDDLRKEIRDNCSPNKAPGFEAPKSRRIVAGSSREIKFVPGWVKFKVL